MNINKIPTLRLTLLLIASLAVQSSHAAEDADKFFIGLGFGVAQISEDDNLFDDSSTAYKALFGYALNEHVSFEGSFVTLDDYEAFSPFVVDTQRAVADGSGFNVATAFGVPVTDRLTIRARIGVLLWSTYSDLADLESSGADLSFGAGINFRVNDGLGIRLDVDAFNFGDVDANVGTAAFEYRF